MTRFPYARLAVSRFFLLLALLAAPEEESDVWNPMWPINDLIKIKLAKMKKTA